MKIIFSIVLDVLLLLIVGRFVNIDWIVVDISVILLEIVVGSLLIAEEEIVVDFNKLKEISDHEFNKVKDFFKEYIG